MRRFGSFGGLGLWGVKTGKQEEKQVGLRLGVVCWHFLRDSEKGAVLQRSLSQLVERARPRATSRLTVSYTIINLYSKPCNSAAYASTFHYTAKISGSLVLSS